MFALLCILVLAILGVYFNWVNDIHQNMSLALYISVCDYIFAHTEML